MPLSWNEIRSRALQFSKDWAEEASEQAEAKSFWDEFFNIFGVNRRRVASFEQHVKKIDGKDGFIDLLWKGVLLIEHKSRGRDLDCAHTQAMDYFPGLVDRDLPRYIIVSDFARFRLYDLDEKTEHEFTLEELHQNINYFGFIAGYQTHTIKDQDPVNIKAAECMGRLHDQMKEVGYGGHPLEVYLVRLLFCMFAEDTGIFERQKFQDYIEQRTNEDGADLAAHLSTLFQVLNTPERKRLKNRDEQLAAFPYVNGKLFEEHLPIAGFDSEMRQVLLDCCALDWSQISPAIFGSLFQSIMDNDARRNLGAHYTSEKNILKLINPLFMDDLWAEFEEIKLLKQKAAYKKRIMNLHKKIRDMTFFDPACGCGNFLVIAYRELRILELEMWKHYQDTQQELFNIDEMIQLNVDQFYGIEIEEFPAQIAQVALWLMDHQMNLLVSEDFGDYFARIPLGSSANIVCGNALQMDWKDVVQIDHLSFIMGNPPFLGKKEQSKEQKDDFRRVMGRIKGYGVLDFVSAWYVKAVEFSLSLDLEKRPDISFVSTNSISQGEQTAVLWRWLLSHKLVINFAHRTFRWNNEAKGVAAVHCVIIGMSLISARNKTLYEYENIKGEALARSVKFINPNLVEADDILIGKRSNSISGSSRMMEGSALIDDGNFLLTDEEANYLSKDKGLSRLVRKLYSGSDFINGRFRWCLWLDGSNPQKWKSNKLIMSKVQQVKDFRGASNRDATNKLASTPSIFGELRQPASNYLFVPKTSSERRQYIPIGFLKSEDLINNTSLFVDGASLYDFGVISSEMHNSWMRTTGGRLKSDYRYSASIVYNNFPWPMEPSDKQKKIIEQKAQDVIASRAEYPEATLADLYDPLTMPRTLIKAHQALDKAVDAAYGKRGFDSEADRVAFLFNLYQQYTSLLPKLDKHIKRRKSG